MAFSLFRVFRFLRSICVPMTAIIGFSVLLTVIFILYQPTPGPGELQRLGWQSWDLVSADIPTGSQDDTTSVPPAAPGDTNEGVDWWNVTVPEGAKVDSASLPLDVWNPLLPHDTGLSEISIERCMINPKVANSICRPATTPEQDAIKGKWVRVEHDLNFQSGMWYLNLWYRRTRRLDVPLTTEIKLLPASEMPPAVNPPYEWHKVERSIRDGVPRTPSLYLWYKTGKTTREMTVKGGRDDYITELDVLYGDSRNWWGFEKADTPVLESDGRKESVWVTYRKKYQAPPKAQPLHFSHDGRFKVLQVADLHFSVSTGVCRDTPAPCHDSDNRTTSLISRVLAAEKPDLVVFTGDQLNGQGTSWDAKSVLAKFAAAVTDAGVPWAAVFGNHDDEDGVSRAEQAKLLQAMPYSLVQPGPKDVHGVGNYVLKVKSADASKTHLLTLYFLDSGAYSSGTLDWFGFWHPTEYDYIHQNQIDWFLQESSSINAIERPFTPDDANDFGDIWKRQSTDQLTPDAKRLAKPNALAFFHIPLQESYDDPDTNPSNSQPLDVGMHGLEPKGSAKKSDGFFEKALLAAKESEHVAGGGVSEVKVVGNGHCHITENCRRVRGVWLCFGGGASYSGYGKVGFDRRFRIYDISDYGETIKTYKRTEQDEIVDEMVLAGKGAAPPYEGVTR
ncbi:Metallo-dependent phosphatase [Heliocybe sulcata]|uniref:Metallo-dependent phosphatase n=1 Tax=Heliocybe sulcata TaxID=5364 RepID=A0A5C3N360_9AGAM|nr:Metallo-dependent phosphatase [Heliocybe sulcata]